MFGLKRGFFFLLTTMLANVGWAQQDAQFTQYMYNIMAVNPAYAGARETLSAAFFYRSQWLGVEGSPISQSLNVHAPVGKKLALGFSALNDEIGNGIVQETNFDLAFSYHFSINKNYKLALGLNASMGILSVNFEDLIGYTEEAGKLPNIEKKMLPNFGVGSFLYTYNFYLGISAPRLLKTEHFDNNNANNTFIASENMTTYLISGYVFYLSEIFKLKPTLMFKYTKGAPLQTDISFNANYADKLTIGIAYRWNTAMSAMLGLQLNSNILLGLSYDRETTALGNTLFNKGSFELFLRYEMVKNKSKVIAPRFF